MEKQERTYAVLLFGTTKEMLLYWASHKNDCQVMLVLCRNVKAYATWCTL